MQTPAPYQRILASINLLMENSKEMQDLKGMSFRSPISIAHEICTIKVGTARMTGHSLAIAHFLLDRSNQHWALITPTLWILQRIIEQIHIANMDHVNQHNNIISRTKNKIKFLNGGSITGMSIHNMDVLLRGHHIDGIVVDCASHLNNEQLDALYMNGNACMVRNRYKYFIFIE